MEKLTWLKQQAEHKYLVWKKYDLIIFFKNVRPILRIEQFIPFPCLIS